MKAIEYGAADALTMLPMDLLAKPILDPLDVDHPDDEIVVTTKRAMTRIALVAVETGGRFEREGIKHDPMSWMLAPRRLFGGSTAIEACQQLEHCRRSILVHGLGLGLDVTPNVIDALVADEGHEPEDSGDGPANEADNIDRKELSEFIDTRKRGRRRRRDGSGPTARPSLWTATMCFSSDTLMVNAFHASIASNVLDVVDRLRAHYGDDIALTADIREGFHQAVPITLALVPAPIADLLKRIEAGPQFGPDPERFAINVEQRIQP